MALRLSFFRSPAPTLSQFESLVTLDVSFNKLTSLSGVQTARSLRQLRAYNNSLETLSGIERYEEAASAARMRWKQRFVTD